MIVHIKNFFEVILGAALPEWIYITFGLLILLSIVLSFLKLVFPKLSKYVYVTILAITLGYILYNVIPLWGVGTKEALLCFISS